MTFLLGGVATRTKLMRALVVRSPHDVALETVAEPVRRRRRGTRRATPGRRVRHGPRAHRRQHRSGLRPLSLDPRSRVGRSTRSVTYPSVGVARRARRRRRHHPVRRLRRVPHRRDESLYHLRRDRIHPSRRDRRSHRRAARQVHRIATSVNARRRRLDRTDGGRVARAHATSPARRTSTS